MKKQLLNEINRIREISGLPSINLISEARVSSLFKNLSRFANDIANPNITNILNKIAINPDTVTDAEIDVLRDFIRNASTLDDEIIDYFVNQNALASNPNELIVQKISGQINSINTSNELINFIDETFGDGAPAIKRWCNANDLPLDDLPYFKRVLNGMKGSASIAIAKKIRFGEMSKKQAKDFLEQWPANVPSDGVWGRLRNILEFITGMPEGDAIWTAYKTGKLSNIGGTNAVQQVGEFNTKLDELTKKMKDIPSYRFKKVAAAKREIDNFVGKNPGMETAWKKLPGPLRAFLLWFVMPANTVAMGVGAREEGGWSDKFDRYIEFWGSIINIPISGLDALDTAEKVASGGLLNLSQDNEEKILMALFKLNSDLFEVNGSFKSGYQIEYTEDGESLHIRNNNDEGKLVKDDDGNNISYTKDQINNKLREIE